MAAWISPAILGAAGLASSVLGIGASRSAEERSWKRNLQMMKMQNDFNVRMWNKSNEYNSPSNQLRLLKEAGINPAVFDANGGNSAASEVTAASADVPNNSQIGQLYKSLDPSDKVISALQTDYQIQKLRTDIQYQKLLNRDFQNELNAREELLSPPLNETSTDDWYYDENGNLVVDVSNSRGYNSYQENRAQRRMNLGTSGIEQQLRSDELEVYQAGKDFLKDMPRWQLQQLKTAIQTATLNNTLLQEDVKLMKEFGISPNDRDGWQSFLKAVLRNPDSIGNLFDHLLGAGQSTIQRGVQRARGYGYSHRNPSSW